MAKNGKTLGEQCKIISLRRLSKATGIEYMKLYNTLNDRYSSLSENEKTEIANAAIAELTPFFDFLGFTMKMIRKN